MYRVFLLRLYVQNCTVVGVSLRWVYLPSTETIQLSLICLSERTSFKKHVNIWYISFNSMGFLYVYFIVCPFTCSVVIVEGDPHPGATRGRMSFQSFNPSIDVSCERLFGFYVFFFLFFSSFAFLQLSVYFRRNLMRWHPTLVKLNRLLQVLAGKMNPSGQCLSTIEFCWNHALCWCSLLPIHHVNAFKKEFIHTGPCLLRLTFPLCRENGSPQCGSDNVELDTSSNDSNGNGKRKQHEVGTEPEHPNKSRKSNHDNQDPNASRSRSSQKLNKREKLDWNVLLPPKSQSKKR